MAKTCDRNCSLRKQRIHAVNLGTHRSIPFIVKSNRKLLRIFPHLFFIPAELLRITAKAWNGANAAEVRYMMEIWCSKSNAPKSGTSVPFPFISATRRNDEMLAPISYTGFFGEWPVRGLICLSWFAKYGHEGNRPEKCQMRQSVANGEVQRMFCFYGPQASQDVFINSYRPP